MDESPGRRVARDRGQQAEQAVRELLVAEGYQLLGERVRLGALELDLVARRGPVLLVVEVRYRSEDSWQSAFGSLSRAKRELLRRAVARLWSRYRADPSLQQVRVEIAAVAFLANETTIERVLLPLA